MSSRNSASFRYFKARLLALGRPAVWIPALILALVAAFLLEYTTNPGWLASSDDDDLGPDQSGLGNTLSEDQLRAAADIDNLEVLSSDLQADAEQQNLDQAGSADAANAAQASEPSAGERYLASRDRNNPSSARSNSNTLPEPFTTGMVNPVNPRSATRTGSSSGGDPYLFSLGLFDGASQNMTTPSATPTVSPLERAILDQQFRSSTASETSDGTTAAESTNPQPADTATSSLTLTEPTQPASLTSQSTGSLPPSVTFIPTSSTMSPPPGTTGYTLPPALTPVTPSGGGTNIYSNSVAPIPGLAAQPSLAPSIPSIGNTFNPVPTITNVGVFGPTISQPLDASSSQVTPQTAPFSASRRQPGRYIGNGEINTFSNP